MKNVSRDVHCLGFTIFLSVHNNVTMSSFKFSIPRPEWLLNCHGDTNALFCVSNCSKHAAQLHILPYIQYRIECYTHIHPCERVGRKYFQEILRRMMRMEWSYICFLVTTGQSPVFLLPSSGRRQAEGWRLSRPESEYIRWDWRLRRAHAPGRITEINYWLEVFTCLIAPNCWAILPLKLPDWVVTVSWVYSVRTGIFSIRKLVFDWCFINFMGFTIINPVFTTFLRQFGFYIFLSALKYDDQMKSTKKYEL